MMIGATLTARANLARAVGARPLSRGERAAAWLLSRGLEVVCGAALGAAGAAAVLALAWLVAGLLP